MADVMWIIWIAIAGVFAYVFYMVVGTTEDTSTDNTATLPSSGSSGGAETALGSLVDAIQGDETTTQLGEWIDAFQELYRQ